MDGQDWTPLSITSKILAAKKAAAKIPHVTQEARQAQKIAAADTPTKQKTLDPASRQAIVAFRVGLKKSQAEFNTMCSFPPNTIRDIEAGRVTPSIGQLNTLNRILKTGLKLF